MVNYPGFHVSIAAAFIVFSATNGSRYLEYMLTCSSLASLDFLRLSDGSLTMYLENILSNNVARTRSWGPG